MFQLDLFGLRSLVLCSFATFRFRIEFYLDQDPRLFLGIFLICFNSSVLSTKIGFCSIATFRFRIELYLDQDPSLLLGIFLICFNSSFLSMNFVRIVVLVVKYVLLAQKIKKTEGKG